MDLRRLALTGCWSTAIGTVILAAWLWTEPLRTRPIDARPGLAEMIVPLRIHSESEAVAGPTLTTMGEAAQRNPFRADRHQALVRHGETAVPPTPAPEAEVPLPDIRIAGVVGGPPWTVVLLGVPGREGGLVLGVHEKWNGFEVQAIHPDSVQILGLDTTWTVGRRPVRPGGR